MRGTRASVILVMLMVLGGCAFRSSAARVRENRPLTHWPWFSASVTPTPGDIQDAMGWAYRGTWTGGRCPFSLLRCHMNGPPLQAQVLTITHVECRYVEEYMDRCSFRMTETVAGSPPARSRCTALLGIVGTSHSLPTWEVYSPGTAPQVTCTRER